MITGLLAAVAVATNCVQAALQPFVGKRWETFLKERVLDPLGMTSTTFLPTDEQLSRRIRLYDVKVGRPAIPRDFHPDMAPPYNDDRIFASAGAGLWTTARDTCKTENADAYTGRMN